ncbi:hypothetical protein ACFLVH_04385, partial [Chloroflexota bacterium]
AIKRTLRITDEKPIHYLKCNHSVQNMVDYLCKQVSDLHIALVIIDSQMAATAGIGHNLSDAEISSQYYNLIRRFGCTTLTIDHTTKTGMTEDSTTETPYGSVVKYNRATSIYSVKTAQDTESDSLFLAIKHEKFNLGRKQATRGIKIEFENNGQGELTGLDFRNFDLAQHESFRQRLPEWQIIQSILKSGPKECAAIAAEAKEDNPETKLDAKRVSDVVHKKSNVFTQLPGSKMWGLVEQRFI